MAFFTHDFWDGFPSFFFCRSWNDMPGHFESFYCEVNPDQYYFTDSSSFDESLKGVNFWHHCYNKVQFIFSIHRVDAHFSFWCKCGRPWQGTNRWWWRSPWHGINGLGFFGEKGFDLFVFVVDPPQTKMLMTLSHCVVRTFLVLSTGVSVTQVSDFASSAIFILASSKALFWSSMNFLCTSRASLFFL